MKNGASNDRKMQLHEITNGASKNKKNEASEHNKL